MADLIRVGLVLDSSGVVRGAREATQAFSSLRKQVNDVQTSTKELVAPLKQLEGAWRTGKITTAAYREELRTTQANLRGLAATTQMTAREEAGFAVQIKAVDAALRTVDASSMRAQSAFIRVGTGVQALSASMAGGSLSVGGLSAAMLGLAGGGTMGLVIAAMASLASLMALASDNTDDLVGSYDALHDRTLRQLRDLEAVLRVQGMGQAQGQLFGGRFAFFNNPAVAAKVRAALAPFLPAGAADQANVRASELRGIIAGRELDDLRAPARRTREPSTRDADRLFTELSQGLGGGTAGRPRALDKAEHSIGAGMARGGDESLKQLKGLAKGFAGARDELLDIGSSLSSGLSAIGASLADGFKGIGKAVLGIIGGMMQQIGHALIMFGLAGKAIRNFIKNPVAAVAVGAGLVILGSALAKSAQGVVNRGGEGGAGSASAGSGFSGTTDSARPQVIVQILGQKTGEVIAEHSYENARYINRGGSPGARSSAVAIPVTGQVVVRRV